MTNISTRSEFVARVGSPRFFVLGLDVRLGVQHFCRHAWLFDLSHPRALGELQAAALEFSDHHATRPGAFDGDSLVMRRSVSESELGAMINSGKIAFAALSQWGCGPLDGFGPILASEPMGAQDLLPVIERALLALESPELPASRRSPRI